MHCTVAVDDLRVGMVVHVDGGWLSHPFAVSTFRIATPQQIATLRRLGSARVRCIADDSGAVVSSAIGDGAETGAASGTGAAVVDETAGGNASDDDGADAVTGDDDAGTADEMRGDARHGADGAADPGVAADAATDRRRLVADEHALQQRCAAQHREATDAWRMAHAAVQRRPLEAAATVTALARTMRDKMVDGGGVRLVTGTADDAAAHAVNVAVTTMLIGRALALPESELVELGIGALMHDVGRAGTLQRHGADAGDAASGNDDDHVVRGVVHGRRMALPAAAVAVIAQHHEHADGSGTPCRIAADRITLPSRIVAIVDRYDALCNPPPGTPALTPHEAVAAMFAQGKSRFDATVLNAFIRVVGVYPAGSLVQLTDDRHAIVVGVDPTRPLRPRVVVHDPAASGDVLPVDLATLCDVAIRRSLPTSRLPPAALAALAPPSRIACYFEPPPAVPRDAATSRPSIAGPSTRVAGPRDAAPAVGRAGIAEAGAATLRDRARAPAR